MPVESISPLTGPADVTRLADRVAALVEAEFHGVAHETLRRAFLELSFRASHGNIIRPVPAATVKPGAATPRRNR
jgi:hypothetical protein